MPRGVSAYDEARLQGRLWQPTTIATDLVGWWDAADLSTISSPSGVSEWRDKSGLGRHLSQSTASNRPTLNISNINGLNSIKFARSSSQCLDLTNFPTSGISGIICFTVSRWQTAGTTNNDIQGLIDNAHGASNGWVIQDRPGLTNNPLSVAHLSQPTTVLDTVQTGDDTWKLISGAMIGGTGGSDSLLVNGALKATAANTNALSLNSSLRVGGTIAQTTRFYNGFHAEIIIISNVTEIVRQTIEGYLSWKWGIQSSIFPTHPFYNRPPLIGAI